LVVPALLLCGALARADAPGSVAIENFSYSPESLTVAAGTEVVWTNRDDDPHTVVSAATIRLFKSPALDTGERFSFVFRKPGTYRYFCTIHPHMQGTIIVK
jgi:plastocyanin